MFKHVNLSCKVWATKTENLDVRGLNHSFAGFYCIKFVPNIKPQIPPKLIAS